MAIYGYTKNYNLIKPEFDSDTWHDYEYDNLDVIDAVLGTILKANNFKGIWKNDEVYNVGDCVAVQETSEIYTVEIQHTTDSSSTFEQFYEEYPEYYNSWNGIALSKDWAIKLGNKVNDGTNEDYSSKAYAISEGLVSEGSAKEWATKATTVYGGLKSAKTYAEQSQTSAEASAASASAALASMNSAEEFKEAAEASAQDSADSAADAMTYANNAQTSAVASEASNQSAASTVNGFDAHAAQKQTEFDNNAAQKQAAVDASANAAAQSATNSQNSADAAAASAAEVAGAVIFIPQTSGSISLETNKNYHQRINAETTYIPPESTELEGSIVHQIFIELSIDTVTAINWGDGVLFVNGEAPDVSTTGTYMIYYQWSFGISKWLVGAYKAGA